MWRKVKWKITNTIASLPSNHTHTKVPRWRKNMMEVKIHKLFSSLIVLWKRRLLIQKNGTPWFTEELPHLTTLYVEAVVWMDNAFFMLCISCSSTSFSFNFEIRAISYHSFHSQITACSGLVLVKEEDCLRLTNPLSILLPFILSSIFYRPAFLHVPILFSPRRLRRSYVNLMNIFFIQKITTNWKNYV